MKYLEQAMTLRDDLIAWAGARQDNRRDHVDKLRVLISSYESVVCAKAWQESAAAKAMYNEGLLGIRRATADVLAKYLEHIANLERELVVLRHPAKDSQG